MIDLNMTPYGLSTAAGLEKSYIADFLNGHRKKSISAIVLPEIARALDCDLAYIFGEQDAPRGRITSLPLAGVIEDHVHRRPMTGAIPSPIPPDPRYPVAGQVAYRIEAGAAGPAGPDAPGFAVALPTPDGAPDDLRVGDVYVVSRDEGDQVETFLARAAAIGGRVGLVRIDGTPPAPADRVVARVVDLRFPLP